MKKQLVLNKGNEKFIFRYNVGCEDKLLECLVEKAKEPQTNFEWFVLFKGQIFTIYDWKCTPAFSVQERTQWHVGAQWRQNTGLISTDNFIQELKDRISNIQNENIFSDQIFIVTITK